MAKRTAVTAGKKQKQSFVRGLRFRGPYADYALLWGGVLLFLVVAGVFSFAAWQHWQKHQLRVAQRLISSKFEGIQVESSTYENDRLQGYVAYAVTDNTAINDQVKRIANAYFTPCKEAGLRSQSPDVLECNAHFEIDFATADHIGITYVFRQHAPAMGEKNKKVSLLYDRHSGQQLGIADVFKPNTPYLETLSRLSRQALMAQLGEKLANNAALQEIVAKATTVHAANFNNFLFTTDEKLVVLYNDLAPAHGIEGTVAAELPSHDLYALFDAKTLQAFFPKLREQKEAERRLAEEIEAQRRRARELVAPNRSNINCAAMKCIALTYDDGPHPAYGPRILDMLKERGAVATFFVLGSKVAANASLLQRAVAEYNEVGNHSWSHSNLANLGSGTIAHEVRQAEQAIYGATGKYSRLMRPPYGAYNSQVVANAGLPIALWSVDTFDWRDRDANIVYQRAIASASPGAVVLLHEIHPTTMEATPRIIDELQRQGYVLVTMSELFGITGENLPQFNGQVLRHR